MFTQVRQVSMSIPYSRTKGICLGATEGMRKLPVIREYKPYKGRINPLPEGQAILLNENKKGVPFFRVALYKMGNAMFVMKETLKIVKGIKEPMKLNREQKKKMRAKTQHKMRMILTEKWV